MRAKRSMACFWVGAADISASDATAECLFNRVVVIEAHLLRIIVRLKITKLHVMRSGSFSSQRVWMPPECWKESQLYQTLEEHKRPRKATQSHPAAVALQLSTSGLEYLVLIRAAPVPLHLWPGYSALTSSYGQDVRSSSERPEFLCNHPSAAPIWVTAADAER